MSGRADSAVRMVVSQLCARVPGGTARYAAALLDALAAAVPDGWRLDGVAARSCPVLEDLPVPVRALGIPDPLLARLWERGLPPRAASRGVVHAPTLLLPPRSARYRLVVTVHDVVPWTHPETLTPRGVAFHRRMGERAARDAAVVVTPTEAVADNVRRVLQPAGPVVAVHSGVAVSAVPGDAPTRRERLGLPPGGYVLFVGTAEPRKGLDVLVAAMAHRALADRFLVVVGPPGWGDVDVIQLAARVGVADRVIATGRVTDSDLAAIYAGARALAMPSRAEGFGFPVVEAMAHAVPVVVTDDAALVEVAGPAALVVPREDASALAHGLGDALDDGVRRADLVAAGPARASRFSWASAASRMWAVYADAAGLPLP